MASGKFIAYYRVSGKKQGRSGLGLEAQEATALAHLNGGDWQLAGRFVEVETGTRKGNKRPELAKALAACKREKATLLIAKLDRLARNVHFVSGLMESGVEFVALDLPGANKFTIHVMAAVAEQESERISYNTKVALAAAKARGVVLGMPSNLTDSGRLLGAVNGAVARTGKAVEAYADVAPRAFALQAQGKSLRSIASTLNAEGFTTRQGAQFTAATVQRILARAAV